MLSSRFSLNTCLVWLTTSSLAPLCLAAMPAISPPEPTLFSSDSVAAPQEQSAPIAADDYHGFAYCAGYISKEFKKTKSSAGGAPVASLKAESEWYTAKLASLQMPALWKLDSVNFGAQLYDLDAQRSGGQPTEQTWHARRHAECSEIAARLFPDEAACFQKESDGSVFTCKSTGVSGLNQPGTQNRSQDQDLQHSSPYSDATSPSGVYQQFLNLRNKKQWSEMFDMFDGDSQHRAAAAMRQMISSIAPEVADAVNSASDREVFVSYFKTGKVTGEIKIAGEHITGDVAILDTKVKRNKTWYDADPRVELHRTNGKWMMYWPQ